MEAEDGTILRRRNPDGQLLDRLHAVKRRKTVNTGENPGVLGGTTADAVVYHPRNSAQKASKPIASATGTGESGLASFSSGTLRLERSGPEPFEGP